MKHSKEKDSGNTDCILSPWFSPNEFKSVLDKVNSDDFDEQGEGLRRMDLWVQRKPGLKLLGVETTLAIAKALWLHECYKRKLENAQHLDNDHFQSLYSSAIIRFINLATESSQQMDYPIPITAIARKMKIPDWIVDVRHSATHSHMPSLQVLEEAARTAFEWLKEHHWENEKNLCSTYTGTNSEKYIPAIEEEEDSYEKPEEDLLAQLLEIHQYLMKNKKRKTLNQDIFERLRILLATTDGQTLASTLLCDGIFFPSFQEILIPSKQAKKKVNFRMLSWEPAFRIFPKRTIQFLLLELFKIANRNDFKGQLAGEWIEFLLRHIKRHKELSFMGDQSRFCLEVMKWIIPKTSVYLKLLFSVYWKRSKGPSLKKFLCLSEHKMSWDLEIPVEVEDVTEPLSSDVEENSDSDMDPVGLTSSQTEKKESNFSLLSATLTKDLFPIQLEDEFDGFPTGENDFSFMIPPIPINLTQVEFEQIGLL